MGSAAPSLPMVDRSIVLRGSVLSPQDQDTLCLPFSAKEISDVGMDSCKALDWMVIMFTCLSKLGVGPSVIAAVQNLFLSGKMPKQVNCTYVTLIPKTENACSVKEFRPIACCSVLYKILSKVLANRMQSVLSSVIGDCQSAFVKGRVIFYNLILSHELVKGYGRKNISPRCMIKIDKRLMTLWSGLLSSSLC